MTAELSPAAIKARLYRARRKAQTPLDVLALLEYGRRMKAQIAARSKSEMELIKIQIAVTNRLKTIRRTYSAQIRARMLGELADWLVKQKEIVLDGLAHPREEIPCLPPRSSRIPAWVPDEMIGVWRLEWKKNGELAAAAKIRALKAGAI